MPHPVLQTSLWETVKCDLKGLFPEDVFAMWFEPIRCVETTEDSLTLGVPNDFASIWIHDNYLDLISQRLRLAARRMLIGIGDLWAERLVRDAEVYRKIDKPQAAALCLREAAVRWPDSPWAEKARQILESGR